MHRTADTNSALAVCEICRWNTLVAVTIWNGPTFLWLKLAKGTIYLICVVHSLVPTQNSRTSRVKLDFLHLQIEDIQETYTYTGKKRMFLRLVLHLP